MASCSSLIRGAAPIAALFALMGCMLLCFGCSGGGGGDAAGGGGDAAGGDAAGGASAQVPLGEDRHARPVAADDVEAYEGRIVIGGEEVEGRRLDALFLEGKLYIGRDLLAEHLGEKVIRCDGSEVRIRRSATPLGDTIEVDGAVYLALDELAGYVPYNKDAYRSSGDLHFNSNSPSSLYVGGRHYQKTRTTAEDAGFGQPDLVLDDGRGAWTRDGDLLVESDDGGVVIYEEVRYGVRQ